MSLASFQDTTLIYKNQLYLRAKTIKFLEKKGQNLHNIRFDNDLLDMTIKAHATKDKIDKLYFIKIYNFCASNDSINRVKRQLTEWEEYLQIINLIRAWYPEYVRKS